MTDSSERSKRETRLVRGQSTHLVRKDDSLALRTLDAIGKLEESSVKEPVEAPPVFASQLEKEVYWRIANRGYRVVWQYLAPSRDVVDLVVEGRFARLGVELDGESYMVPTKRQEERMMLRDKILELGGLPLVHIRVGAYSRDPEAALAPLWEKLGELGILPHQEAGAAPKKVGP